MSDLTDLLRIAIDATGHGADLVRGTLPDTLTFKGDRDYASNVD